MKTRKCFTVFLLLLISHSVFSQGTNECKEIAKKVFKGIENDSSEILLPHLADDFTISGRKGKIAGMVLEQLFSQLKINSFEIKRATTNSKVNKLIYSVEYVGLGTKQSILTLNKNCELETLKLFKMEVKTLDEGGTKIDKPTDDIIEIPFEMRGKLITVDVLLDNQKRTFLFDSGSPIVLLNSRYTSSNKDQMSISSTKGVTGKNISGVDIEVVKKLDFAGIKLTDQKIVNTDLSGLEKDYDIEIYGIIGYEMFKDYDLCIDYSDKVITLIKPDFFESFRENNLSNNKIVSTSLMMEGHIPVVAIEINNEKLNFGIDSGAEANLISETLYPNFEKNLKDLKTDSLSGAEGSSKNAKNGILDRIFINSKIFKNLKTYFSDITHLNKDKKVKIDGLIGYPVLSKQKTIISFKRKEILFVE